MKISKIYFLLAVPVLLLGLLACSSNPEFLVDLGVDVFHALGYKNQGLSEKLSVIIKASFGGVTDDYNYLFISLLVVFIASCFYYFIFYEKHAVLVFFLAVFCFPILNLFVDAIWIRRFIFSVLILPTFPKIWSYLVSGVIVLGGGYYYQNLLKFLSGIFLSILLIPGFYLPPFFDGIAGWYIKNDSPQSYVLTQLRVRFSDNSTVWFRPSMFNPLTMHNRPFNAIKKRDPDFYNSVNFFYFLHNLYRKAYPSLAEQKLPTEERLGRFAYLPHTIDKFDTREKFLPPSEIVAFELVHIIKHDGIRSETIRQIWLSE